MAEKILGRLGIGEWLAWEDSPYVFWVRILPTLVRTISATEWQLHEKEYNWCVEQFGKPKKHGNPTSPWNYYEGRFCFFNEDDRTMFILTWL